MLEGEETVDQLMTESDDWKTEKWVQHLLTCIVMQCLHLHTLNIVFIYNFTVYVWSILRYFYWL